MSSLKASLSKYQSELADAASRTYTRPSSSAPVRTSTPKPEDSTASSDSAKRSHETAFSQPAPVSSGAELLTQVVHAVDHLKSKAGQKNSILSFDSIVSYLSLPNDSRRNIPNIRAALITNKRVEFIPKSRSPNGQDSFQYRPTHPVTNAEELKYYLQRQPTAQGIPVRELKDGWADCNAAIDALEKERWVLVTRNKKDETPKMVWADNPDWHISVSSDFKSFLSKTKLPGSEVEIRAELERAGLTPTSQVKEARKGDQRRKERKKATRRGGKTTNSHMMGILKDYSKR